LTRVQQAPKSAKRQQREREKKTQEKANSDPSESLRQDIVLLREYGFKKRSIHSTPLNLKKIDNFGMRQLDRLKMLLLRNEKLIGEYPPRVRNGINRNDPHFFAEGLAILSFKLPEI
jgi:hypothetical protein